jgi:hypothetical protein
MLCVSFFHESGVTVFLSTLFQSDFAPLFSVQSRLLTWPDPFVEGLFVCSNGIRPVRCVPCSLRAVSVLTVFDSGYSEEYDSDEPLG